MVWMVFVDPHLRVILVEDEPQVRMYLQHLLQSLGCAVECLEPFDLVRSDRIPVTTDLLLLDTTLPGFDIVPLLRKLRREHPKLCIVLLLAGGSHGGLLAGCREAVYDVLPKLFMKHQLDTILHDVRQHVLAYRGPTARTSIVHHDLGNGTFFLAAAPAMKKVYEQVAAIALADIPVMITGESGVGKEVVARLIHRLSRRSPAELLKINCAALPHDLLESELFGYEAGAFTGAVKAKPGRFELCENGTLLLDEIGEMSPPLQAKLLHVLQDGTFSRLAARGESRCLMRYKYGFKASNNYGDGQAGRSAKAGTFVDCAHGIGCGSGASVLREAE